MEALLEKPDENQNGRATKKSRKKVKNEKRKRHSPNKSSFLSPPRIYIYIYY
jgi:hypothetical protein